MSFMKYSNALKPPANYQAEGSTKDKNIIKIYFHLQRDEDTYQRLKDVFQIGFW